MLERPPQPAGTDSEQTAAARPRAAVVAHFLCNGVGLGVWASRLPAVKDQLAIDDRDLGLVLFLAALGAMASLRAAGRVIERFGSRPTTAVAGLALMAAFALPAASVGLPSLGLSLLALGATVSMQDVAMNSQAVAIERRYGRPIMSSFHAAFSVGGMVGAGIGALTASLAISFRPTFVVVSAIAVVAILVANRFLLDAPETGRRPAHVERDRTRLPERGALLALGAIGFASFVAEGAAADWTTIYLRDGTGSTEAVAAVGFVVFSVTMTAGRLAGDRLAARFGAMPLIRAGTALAGAGLVTAIAVGTTAAGFLGFAALGAGLSIVVPQVFSAAGFIAPTRAAAALSWVSSISYLGLLVGPASIGALSHEANLRVALLMPAVLVLAASVLASRLHASADSA